MAQAYEEGQVSQTRYAFNCISHQRGPIYAIPEVTLEEVKERTPIKADCLPDGSVVRTSCPLTYLATHGIWHETRSTIREH